MACDLYNSTCPLPGDQSVNLLGKILQVLNNSSGGGGGAGVSAIKVNGGPNQTGVVSLTIPQNTDELPEGSVNFYYTEGRFNTSFAGKTTDGLAQGATNLYFTEPKVLATVLTGFASALGAITAADSVLSAFGKTQGRLAALEAGTAGPFLLRAGDTGTGAFLFTPSANNVVPLTLTTTAGSATTSDSFLVNYGASSLLALRNDGRLTLNGRAAFLTTSSIGHALSVSDANSSTAVVVNSFGHTLSGGPPSAAGFGALCDWNLDSSTTALTRASRWQVAWSDATHATRNSIVTINTFVSGTETPQLILGSNQVQGNQGTAAAPAFTYRNDTDNGLWFPAANTVGLAVGGVDAFEMDANMAFFSKTSADTAGYELRLRKNRSGGVITAGDTLGSILFRGNDGSNYLTAASIRAVNTGTVASTRVASSLIFATATDSAPSVLTDALTIDNTQKSTFAGQVKVQKSFASAVSTLTDAATIATDASLGNLFVVVLGGNRTLGNPTNPTDGQKVVWQFVQDGSGNRTITLDTKFTFGTDITGITLSTGAGKIDFMTCIYRQQLDKWHVVGFVKGY